MKIGICSALATKVDPSLSYIGVDRGVEVLLNQGIIPIYAIGDFDSIENPHLVSTLETTQLPTRKDVTDTQAAIEYAISQGYDEIDLYGVTGGRLDHFIGALCLLEKYSDLKLKIIDQQNSIYLLNPGEHIIRNEGYYYFSLFALEHSIIDIEHAQYPLQQYELYRSDPLCVSNQTIDNYAIVRNSDKIILIQSKDRKA